MVEAIDPLLSSKGIVHEAAEKREDSEELCALEEVCAWFAKLDLLRCSQARALGREVSAFMVAASMATASRVMEQLVCLND
jgi:hypothetical protein